MGSREWPEEVETARLALRQDHPGLGLFMLWECLENQGGHLVAMDLMDFDSGKARSSLVDQAD